MTTNFNKLNTEQMYKHYYKYTVDGEDFTITFRTTDGYVNATKLCALGTSRCGNSKKFTTWAKRISNEELKQKISIACGVPVDKLTEVVQCGKHNDVSGTYVHPELVMHIASWISADFAISVNNMLKAWRAITPDNEQTYWGNMVHCLALPSMCDDDDETEAGISNSLAQTRNGEREVETPVGRIDVLTPTEVIEVKRIQLWKHALGQILAYGDFYPDHVKKIYLYNDRNTIFDDNIIRRICNNYHVVVEIHDILVI
jgi:KilA-N domain